MKKIILNLLIGLNLLALGLVLLLVACGQQVSTTYDNGIPYPTKDVVFQLDALNSPDQVFPTVEASSTSAGRNRAKEIAVNAYWQAGINLGYFEGFDPVLSSFRSDTLTAIGSNEYTFQNSYPADTAIPYKGLITHLTAESRYLVKVWGIRPGESSYRRWVYGDFISPEVGSIIIDPYIMWTSTHDMPMTIKFDYNASLIDTKTCTGGVTGSWSGSGFSTREVIGSSYFFVSEDNSDPNNTIVTYKVYESSTYESLGLNLYYINYGKFNRDTNRLHGRMLDNGYPSDDPDSGLMFIDTANFVSLEGAVPSNIDASSMTVPATPEASYASWPASSVFPETPTF